MYCKHCGAEIGENSIYCNICGHKITGDSNKVVIDGIMEFTKKNKRVLIVVAIALFLLMVIYLAAFRGPSRRLIMDTYWKDNLSRASNPVILGKSRCQNISTEAKSYGVTDAWLVTLDDEWINYPHPDLWVRINGDWIDVFGDECP